MRPLPAPVPPPRGPARLLLRPRARGRRARPHDLRALERVLRRPDREEAAQPLPAGHAGALVRHRRLQPRLQLLPELGHLASRARWTRSPTRPPRSRSRRPRERLGCRTRRLHLQRPGHLPRVRRRHRDGLPRARASRPSRSRPATSAPSRVPSSSRTWTRRTSTSRASTTASTAASAAAASRRCWRRSSTSHRETDVWLELTTLLIPGLNDSDAELDALTALGRSSTRPRRAAALHRLPSRLENARPPPTPAGDAGPGTPDRARERRPLRLHRQRLGRRGAVDLVPPLRFAPDRAELVPPRRLEPDSGRTLRRLRRALRRRLRGPAGRLGRTSAAGANCRRVNAVAEAPSPPAASTRPTRRELAGLVDGLLDAAPAPVLPAGRLRALVVPHAGYGYSGEVAAAGFVAIPADTDGLRVVFLGPSHFVPLQSPAVSDADVWETPLGPVPVDRELCTAALAAGAVADERPHRDDHALEVELPFLQRRAGGGLRIVPIAIGTATGAAGLLSALASDALVVVSSDLSHYSRGRRRAEARLSHGTGRARPRRRSGRRSRRLRCRRTARPAATCARARLDRHAARPSDVSRRGRRPGQVVGYGAFAFTAPD